MAHNVFDVGQDTAQRQRGRPGPPENWGRAAAFLRAYLSAARMCLYTFTTGVARPESRSLIRRLSEASTHAAHNPIWTSEQYLPGLPTERLILAHTSVHLHEPGAIIRQGTADELLILATLVRALAPLVCFEIGALNRGTALNMAANAPHDGIVYTLEPPGSQMMMAGDPLPANERSPQVSGTRRQSTRADSVPQDRIRPLYGGPATFDYTPYQNTIDFVFINGLRTYESVMQASVHALGMLRDGRGAIVWNGYTAWPAVRGAINELQRSDPRFAATRYLVRTPFACLIPGEVGLPAVSCPS